MANKASGASKTAQAQAYKTLRRWETNRKRKLARALKRNPENAEQINKALAQIVYRRKTPTTPQWSHTDKLTAQMLKRVCGKMTMKVFSTDAKDAGYALATLHNPNWKKVGTNGTGSMFALGLRVVDKA